MARWETHQTDANQPALVELWTKAGVQVEKLGRPVDLLLSYQGVTALVEVKTATGKLRPSQVAFFARFQGLARVIRSEADAVALLQDMQQQAKQS